MTVNLKLRDQTDARDNQIARSGLVTELTETE